MHCSNTNCSNKINSLYISQILGLLGPVILGSKPSEILNISIRDINKESKLNDIKKFFSNCSKISYRVIYMNDTSYRLLFFNKDTLNNAFTKKSINFLKFIGYPKEFCFDTYLDILVDRLHDRDFPHEIGIFLGYPLKDVVGFMGYGSHSFVKTNLWRIYGDETISNEVSQRFLDDKYKFRAMLKNTDLNDLKAII